MSEPCERGDVALKIMVAETVSGRRRGVSQFNAVKIWRVLIPLLAAKKAAETGKISDVGYLSAAIQTPEAATSIVTAFFKSASAILMLAMSIRRPSSDTAPFPALAASAIALTIRRALVTSASDGVNT